MIGSLRGALIGRTPSRLVVDCGGIGFNVHVSPVDSGRAGKIGDAVRLFIHTYMREDAADLYGFIDESDLGYFELLIKVKGIGPRTALGIVAVLPRDTFVSAVASHNIDLLKKVPGIGPKTAERLVFELKDRLELEVDESGGASPGGMETAASEALRNLGFDQKKSREAVSKALREKPGAALEELVTHALRLLRPS